MVSKSGSGTCVGPGGADLSGSPDQLGPGERITACDTGPEKSVEELALKVPAGEPPAELGEVGLEMVGGNAVVDTPEHTLHVGDKYVHPRELLGRGRPAPQDHSVVLETGEPTSVGAESVGFDTGPSVNSLVGHFLDLVRFHTFENTHGCVYGAFFSHAYPDEYRRLTVGSPSPLPALGAAEVAIVQLDETGELVAGVPLPHGRPYLVGYEPGALVGDADQSCRPQDGDTGLHVRHEEDKPEPGPKRRLGLLHDGPSGEGRLVSAVAALVEIATGDPLVLPAPAAGTCESIGPPTGEEVGPARFLGRERLGELEKAPYLNVSAVSQRYYPPAHSVAGGCDNILWLPEQMS